MLCLRMNRLTNPEVRFSWPRTRNKVLKTTLVNSTVTEHMCSEVIFVDKVTENYDIKAITQLGKQWGTLAKTAQKAIPIFVDICRNMSQEGLDATETNRFRSFYKILDRFCEKHSNAYMELNIGRVHFKLNHLIAVVKQIMSHEKRNSLDLGIKDFAIFQKNITFLFDLAIGERFNIIYAEYKEASYPSTSLIDELLIAIVNDKTTLEPILELNKEIYPVTIGGGTIAIDEGHWVIITTIGQYPGLFGQAGLGPSHQSALFGVSIVPKYRTFRLVSFFSRTWGPGIPNFWSLKGVITFDFGNDSASALEMSRTASDDKWRKVLDSSLRKSELLPEPLLSTPAFKILGSMAEH